jgi:hypothetical protein
MRTEVVKISLILLINTLIIQFQQAQEPDFEIKSTRIACYDIQVKLDTKLKMLNGKMILHWRNTTSDTIHELHFHAYMNAFKNTSSSYMQESVDYLSANWISIADDDIWGWIEIQHIALVGGEDITKTLRYLQPDDQNLNDQTVFSVRLKDAVKPGQTKDIEIEFRTKLPKIIDRTGYAKDFYMIAQWFPKIGVYETKGEGYATKSRWNCHQYHRNSGFFSDFGVYNVTINVPEDFSVGASGEQIKSANIGDGTKSFLFRANDMIDFAWTASPDFKTTVRKWKNRTNVILMLQQEHTESILRYFNTAFASLDYLDKHVGAYPYSTLTIVDPPLYAFRAGANQYPTLITGMAPAYLTKGFRITESVVANGIANQYFMAILANNEVEEPWLNQGFSAYFESRIMDENLGKEQSFVNFWGIRSGTAEYQRSNYVHDEIIKLAETNNFSWNIPIQEFLPTMNDKPAVFLTTFDNLIGREKTDEIVQKYYQLYSFQHPVSQDFIKTAQDVMKNDTSLQKPDILGYFNQFLYGSTFCDFELKEISNIQLVGNIGAYDKVGTTVVKMNADTEQEKYRSKIILLRKGEIILPVEVLIEFENGTKIKKYWNGKNRSKEFVFEGNSKIIKAVIDPEHILLVDTNYLNNSKQIYLHKSGIYKYVLKFLFWLQNIMQSVAFFA